MMLLRGEICYRPCTARVKTDRRPYFTGYVYPFAMFHTVVDGLDLLTMLYVFYGCVFLHKP